MVCKKVGLGCAVLHGRPSGEYAPSLIIYQWWFELQYTAQPKMSKGYFRLVGRIGDDPDQHEDIDTIAKQIPFTLGNKTNASEYLSLNKRINAYQLYCAVQGEMSHPSRTCVSAVKTTQSPESTLGYTGTMRLPNIW